MSYIMFNSTVEYSSISVDYQIDFHEKCLLRPVLDCHVNEIIQQPNMSEIKPSGPLSASTSN